MIKSMTGFGRCEIQKESRKFTVELKSVNHRYLDVNPYAFKAVCQPWEGRHFYFL